MSKDESLIDLVSVMYKNRKKIIIACLAAAIISSLVSLLMPNFYKSTTIFYPASADLAKPLPTGNEVINRNYYGDSKDLDRLLSISLSNEVSNFLIDSFNLYSHYRIDTTSKRAPLQIATKLKKLFTPVKSKYDAIELSVEDVSGEFAANMCNAARNKIHDLAQKLIKESQYNLLESYKANVANKEIGLALISDSLNRVRALYEIYNPTSQGQTFGEILPATEAALEKAKSKLNAYINNRGPQDSIKKMRIEVAGFDGQLKTLLARIKKYNDGYSEVSSLEREQNIFAEQLAKDKEKLKQLQATYVSPFNAIHLVQEAEVPLIKSRPKRSLIVIGLTLLTGLMSMLVILVLHQYRTQGWRDKIIK